MKNDAPYQITKTRVVNGFDYSLVRKADNFVLTGPIHTTSPVPPVDLRKQQARLNSLATLNKMWVT